MSSAAGSLKEFCDDPFQRRVRIVIFFGLFALCAFVRLWDLDLKTMMHDELLFTNYTYYDLYQNVSYRYQPILHGPLMLHIQNIVFHLFGDSNYTVRLGAALLGVFGFFWIWKLRYWLGEAGTWFALGFYAIAPGISFFHRFFHQDSLYLFNSLWIIASLANWWRTRDGRWAASSVIGAAALFNTKASAVFIYFTIGTFVLLVVIHDLVAYFLEGKDARRANLLEKIPRFPASPWIMVLAAGGATLVLTQVFEGLRLSLTSSERQLLGHDWALRDVRSIPLALGWTELSPQAAREAGAAASGMFWRLFYAALFIGTLIAGFVLKVAVDHRIGRTEFLPSIWKRIYDARYYLLGALAFSAAFYLAIYTTFFKFEIGFFEIYQDTWAYWGGQHELGRIQGPFHQHMLNILVYELPAALIVLTAWIIGLFRVKWSHTTGVAFLLMIVAVGAFHKLLFSGLQVQTPGRGIVDADVNYLKYIFFAGLACGVVTLLLPRAGRVLLPASLAALVIFSIGYFVRPWWQTLMDSKVYRDGDKVEMMGGHVTLERLMEVEFNFDGGTSLAIVLVLIFFATIYTWYALQRGERFHAFLVWWFVTMLGSASYAREAVPQVGIHAMMPVILLAASYFNRFVASNPQPMLRRGVYIGMAVLALWNVKACFNLNFENPSDPRERMVYGPSNPDVKSHMMFVRDYTKIASLRMEGGTPYAYQNYNDAERHKDVQIFIKPLDQVSWPAKWYFRDIAYEEGSDPSRAIEEEYDFLFLAVEDRNKYPQLEEEYRILRGRGTTFWTPNRISTVSLLNIWKEFIPGHYLDSSPEASQAFEAKQDWGRIWRYLILRETFEGTGRTVPSISSFEYIFCFRKDLY